MKTHFYIDDILKICKKDHYTVDEIFKKLKKKYPQVGKSSVYRNVKDLLGKGELIAIQGKSKKAYFETSKESHAHFICDKTGNIVDIPFKYFNFDKLPKKYKIRKFDVKVYGTCDKH